MSTTTVTESGKPSKSINGLQVLVFGDSEPEKVAEAFTGPSPYAKEPLDGPSVKKSYPTPLKVSGTLDAKYQYHEVSGVIGREYPDAQLSDILKDDQLVKDLAITISRRGVVFFRNQDLNIHDQKKLAQALGLSVGKPKTSHLHIHPAASAGGIAVDGKVDHEITLISSRWSRELYAQRDNEPEKRDDAGFHIDNMFEPVPSDYSILKIIEPPAHGAGDTVYASSAALYDKVSPSMRNYLESLTGTFYQPGFKAVESTGFRFFSGPRGAPENVGDILTAIHPAVRTNPVTGWKALTTIGGYFTKFNEVTSDESDSLLKYVRTLLLSSHELFVRMRWGKDDIAIWDNRSVYHAGTPLNDPEDIRTGVRAVGLGERPYLDKKSKTRKEDLKEQGLTW